MFSEARGSSSTSMGGSKGGADNPTPRQHALMTSLCQAFDLPVPPLLAELPLGSEWAGKVYGLQDRFGFIVSPSFRGHLYFNHASCDFRKMQVGTPVIFTIEPVREKGQLTDKRMAGNMRVSMRHEDYAINFVERFQGVYKVGGVRDDGRDLPPTIDFLPNENKNGREKKKKRTPSTSSEPPSPAVGGTGNVTRVNKPTLTAVISDTSAPLLENGTPVTFELAIIKPAMRAVAKEVMQCMHGSQML